MDIFRLHPLNLRIQPRELMDEFGFEDDPEDRERADSSVPCRKGGLGG